MTAHDLLLPEGDLRKLLTAANPDAALYYLYIKAGNDPQSAETELKLSRSRLTLAATALRQTGLLTEEKPQHIFPAERPQYSEQEVVTALEKDEAFSSLYHAVQQLFGRALNTDELKILLGFERYLGLPTDVVYTLIHYCRDRLRQKGSNRNPSLRSIEKEAYVWADNGIDTMEEASAYIHAQNLRSSRLHKLMDQLQIHGRALTPAEEAYAVSWLDMGFDDGAIAIAYERSCLKTGGLNWKYMNGIFKKWHESGLHTAQEIQSGDAKQPLPKGASGRLGEEEREAIRAILQQGEE